MDKNESLLQVNELKKYFPVYAGVFRRVVDQIKAVDGISFAIKPGETLGLVGESGCGKTTAGRVITRLTEATDGAVSYKGQNVLSLSGRELKEYRKKVQLIFQDPYNSLNPKLNVANIVGEPLKIHGLVKNRKQRIARVKELLDRVGLRAEYLHRYPHAFSGGQRQRIGVARALAVEPDLIIADEPVSALDVSVQAQVVNLMQDLQEEYNIAYLSIAHDLAVVKHISDRVAVMYLGKIVEVTRKEKLYDNPLHPYTQTLLSAVPLPDPAQRKEKDEDKSEVEKNDGNYHWGCVLFCADRV